MCVCFFASFQFGHVVELVQPMKDNSEWRIDVRELETDAVTSHVFDAVIVCNG